MGTDSEDVTELAAELADDRIIQQARELLAELAEGWTIAKTEQAVSTGCAEWRLDPFVVGVVHLVKTGTDRVSVVVYLNDHEFEVDEELLAETNGDVPQA
jgi:DICT domain-containing protein